LEEFWFLADLAAIFAGLEFGGLLYLQHFTAKRPGYASRSSGCPASVHRYGMGLASGNIYPQDLPLFPPLSHRYDKLG
jgi:hypothetical protein